MSAYTQTYYHIVFSTKDRHPVLRQERREALFRYIWGILKNRESHLYRINGADDHLHILTSLHPSVSLADLVKDVKTGSSLWIKRYVPVGFTHGYSPFAPSGQPLTACHLAEGSSLCV
jgi:REP element-mobilizing transposase RayT